MRYENKKFIKERIELDGNKFIGCTIESCVLIYRGTGVFSLEYDRISTDTKFEFRDGAGNTVNAMKAIYSGLGSWGRNTILAIFKDIAPDLKKLN